MVSLRLKLTHYQQSLSGNRCYTFFVVSTPSNSGLPTQASLRFGVFQLDLATGELWKSGRKLRLQEQPFQILAILAQRPGELVSREELVRTLWPDGTFVDYDHSLNTAVNKLREALSDSANSPRYIETLPHRGYRFIGSIAAPEGNNAAVAEPIADIELPHPDRRIVRSLFVLAQLMYMSFYAASLMHIEKIHHLARPFFRVGADPLAGAVVVTALAGIPLRFFLITAVGFDYRGLRAKYERLFPLLVVLDEFWGLCPLLMAPRIGIGLALALVAGLLYLPFGQRTLIRMSY